VQSHHSTTQHASAYMHAPNISLAPLTHTRPSSHQEQDPNRSWAATPQLLLQPGSRLHRQHKYACYTLQNTGQLTQHKRCCQNDTTHTHTHTCTQSRTTTPHSAPQHSSPWFPGLVPGLVRVGVALKWTSVRCCCCSGGSCCYSVCKAPGVHDPTWTCIGSCRTAAPLL
jgi:hypothetical protein